MKASWLNVSSTIMLVWRPVRTTIYRNCSEKQTYSM